MATRSTAPRLTRAAVVRRATAISAAEGLGAVTIRRLAVELGVTPMALYWHFTNKDALLDALAEHAAAAVPLRQDGPDWAEDLRALLGDLVGALHLTPALAPLVQTRVLSGHAGAGLAERTLALLERAGFTGRGAAELALVLLGSAVAVAAGCGTGPATAGRRLARALALPADRFPRVVASADVLSGGLAHDPRHPAGVSLLLEGVRALPRD
ncbi:TetR/AcrR family transcriptional regulator [Actinosynnema sp.]|uniref:TetR/AcrR family transcriptional regulator n=1 Tax=Actinosynnema sp. TaxID=1872144 RepID=UPI003F836FC1